MGILNGDFKWGFGGLCMGILKGDSEWGI